MSLDQAYGLRAVPLECETCGRPITLPRREEALLDERGWAHVPCACGTIHTIPFEPMEPIPDKKRKRRASWELAALWIVILALILLLLPTVSYINQPEPEPPSYLTT